MAAVVVNKVGHRPKSDVVDPADFADSGMLLEANRRFFHPLGLNLAVRMDTGALVVVDLRAGSEGGLFDASGPDFAAKAARAKAEVDAKFAAREAALGFVEQPL